VIRVRLVLEAIHHAEEIKGTEVEELMDLGKEVAERISNESNLDFTYTLGIGYQESPTEQ